MTTEGLKGAAVGSGKGFKLCAFCDKQRQPVYSHSNASVLI